MFCAGLRVDNHLQFLDRAWDRWCTKCSCLCHEFGPFEDQQIPKSSLPLGKWVKGMSNTMRWSSFVLVSTVCFAVGPTLQIILSGQLHPRAMQIEDVLLVLAAIILPLIPLLGSFFLPLDKRSITAKHVVPSLCILLCLISIGATFWIGISAQSRIDSVLKRAELDLAPMIKQLETRRLKGRPESYEITDKLFLALVNSEVPISNNPLGPLLLANSWDKFYYPADVLDELNRGALHALPPLTPKVAVIVTQGGTEFDRMIKLDDGSVPGLRRSEIITLLDIQSDAILGQSGPVLGPSPDDPVHKPGIQYFAKIIGKEPSWSQRIAAIESICHCGYRAH